LQYLIGVIPTFVIPTKALLSSAYYSLPMRGRPPKSAIRQNIVELLHVKVKAHGYQVYKWYREIFPACAARTVYYHLRKGVLLGEFIISEVRQEKGDYSWGPSAQKTYYALGEKAAPTGDARVAEFFKCNADSLPITATQVRNP